MITRIALFLAAIMPIFLSEAAVARDFHADRPSWVVQEPAPTTGEYYFVGLSEPQPTELAAREGARKHVLMQAADFAGIRVIHSSEEDRTRKSVAGAGDVFVDGAALSETASELLVRRLQTMEWFLERQPGPDAHRSMWVAHLLAAIPRAEIEKAIEEDQSRRAMTAGDGRTYPQGAVVCIVDSASPFSAILKTAVEQYLSKFHIPILDQAAVLSNLPILRLSIAVDRENTVYDHQFVLARIVCRVQWRLPDGTTVTDNVVAGARRAYARTAEIATETAVDDFLQDEGRQLIRAIRGW